MKVFLLGKIGGITHWLEDAAGGLRTAGHQVRLGVTRLAWLSPTLERALAPTTAARIARRISAFGPDLILAVGGYHAPRTVLETIAALPGRPPLVGWVGDGFGEDANCLSRSYDLVGYTDTGLLARHVALGFTAASLYLPHAVDPRRAPARPPQARRPGLVLVANPTPHRRAVVGGLERPIALHGPAWTPSPGIDHAIHRGRLPPRKVMRLYEHFAAALNIRNEFNVVHGLNQRNFDPCLAGAAVFAEDQPDLPLCFEPGLEVAAYASVAALNDLHGRLRREPAWAAEIGTRGRRRVLAGHTFAHRLDALVARL